MHAAITNAAKRFFKMKLETKYRIGMVNGPAVQETALAVNSEVPNIFIAWATNQVCGHALGYGSLLNVLVQKSHL